MKNKLFFVIVILLFVVSCTTMNGFKPEAGGKASPLTEATPARALVACNDLPRVFSYTNTVISSVSQVPAGTLRIPGIAEAMPEHCVVKGKMNERKSPVDGKMYAIGFEMRLPTSWNGRFFYQANGGLDGMVINAYGDVLSGGPTSNGLLKGFAVISSDAGHQMEQGPIGGGLFGLDPQARLDYGYNAVAALTPMAKNLIKTYYGKMPDKSYIAGGSNGGRHTMVAAARYADQYDGYLAASPGFNLPKAAIAQLWGVQQYAPISKISPATGRPDVATSFSQADLQLVSDKIVAKCDNLDGLNDHMVSDVKKCQSAFNIATDVPTCSAAPDGTCLTEAQKKVLAAVHTGARNSAGQPLYTNFFWDPGIASANWGFWKFANSTGPRDPLAVGFVFMTPPVSPSVLSGTGNTLIDFDLGFNMDTDAPKIYATSSIYTESAMSFMTPPDATVLSGFVANNRKMIVYHGAADPIFSASDTINWYEDFKARYGQKAYDMIRLFVVPGMAHVRGGPSTDQFDLTDALVDWVEKGIAPDSVVARARGKGVVAADVVNAEVPVSWSPGRTRLLCAYPEIPKYKGSGDTEAASSFSCVVP
ncbi:MAG TPA: tannase/feruloyl esterase family alpha/beta hydrolase [Syntrophorhabdaceae bacterium]|nr:tannase/feruloyl esterase family alpha/beta hydrolase [Syntrophorhabdaceae bacterium]